MWIYLNNAFFSIVDKTHGEGDLLVRARFAGDIEKVFPGTKVTVLDHTDYRFRANINRDKVAEAIADSVRNITYGNFKNSVDETWRHDAYEDCWAIMMNEQHRQRRKRGE